MPVDPTLLSYQLDRVKEVDSGTVQTEGVD